MSNISLIIEEKAADIGNFLVGRLLPFVQKKNVGPFVFIDHMGPKNLSADENLDIAPHPHIGLSTLTFLFEGALMHRDSLGNQMEITPGAVNWMSAGKGVVHSERTPDRLRDKAKVLHGLQIWVALPLDKEQMSPTFQHVESTEIPLWHINSVRYRLIAGTLMDKISPVKAYSKFYFLEIFTPQDAFIDIGEELYGEVAMYILEGQVTLEGQLMGGKQLIIAKDAKLCSFEMQSGTTLYLFGGEPLQEQHYIDWNFVSADKARIAKAREDWYYQNHEVFPKVVGEGDEYVPLPARSLPLR